MSSSPNENVLKITKITGTWMPEKLDHFLETTVSIVTRHNRPRGKFGNTPSETKN